MSQAGSPGQRHSQDSDEFANLPDVVDFAAIPPMVASTGDSDERDEFAEYEHYNEADPFVGIDFDAIPELGVAPSLQVAVPPGQQTQSNDTAMTQGASDASSQYEFDELDASVWDEVDTIVRNAMAEPEAIPQTQVEPPAPTQAQHHVQPAPDTGSLSASRDVSVSIPQTQLSTRSSLKRARSNSSVNSNYSMYKKSKGKGKARADPHASVRKVLAGLEESLICSICFHIFSEPHAASPCGHTFCGDCIVSWMKQNIRDAPRCPVCRAALTQGSLVVPNYALKYVIEKHLAAQAEAGVVDWQPQGRLYLEWTQRNADWLQRADELLVFQGRRWGPQNGVAAQQAAVPNPQPLIEDPSSSDESSGDEDDIFWAPTPSAHNT